MNHREPIVYDVPRQERPENKIKLGMSEAEVRENWGEPIKIIKGNGKQFDERWIYQPHWKCQRRLEFKDGILIYGVKEA
ncbi:MAG: hypothetical protein HGA87_04525 [Desulfobulbaceae bacterium]|nr:hypothetical protein [Desulfobulbaceae bacterium]